MTGAPEAGFSLTETLVALVIISLSLAGVFAVTGLWSHVQHKVVSETARMRGVQAQVKTLAGRLDRRGPFTAQAFSGTPSQFIVTRDGTAIVGYQAPAGVKLLYVGKTGARDHWPDERLIDSDGHPDATRQGRVRAIIMTDVSGVPLAVVRLRADAAQTCTFDMASNTCSEAGS